MVPLRAGCSPRSRCQSVGSAKSRLGLRTTHICYLPMYISPVGAGARVSSREDEALQNPVQSVKPSVAWRNKECLMAKMLLCI